MNKQCRKLRSECFEISYKIRFTRDFTEQEKEILAFYLKELNKNNTDKIKLYEQQLAFLKGIYDE